MERIYRPCGPCNSMGIRNDEPCKFCNGSGRVAWGYTELNINKRLNSIEKKLDELLGKKPKTRKKKQEA